MPEQRQQGRAHNHVHATSSHNQVSSHGSLPPLQEEPAAESRRLTVQDERGGWQGLGEAESAAPVILLQQKGKGPEVS